MKHFAYVCGDPGIPVPGNKGASNHVSSVCKALVAAGLHGELHVIRATADSLVRLPIRPIATIPGDKTQGEAKRELRRALSGMRTHIPTAADCDFIYERYSMWHLGGLERALTTGVPFILEVNSPLPEEASRFRSLGQAELANGIAAILLRHADGIVCVSELVADWVRKLRGRDEGVWVVPNGVDTEMFRPGDGTRPEGLPDKNIPLLGFAGSFRPWHDLTDLLTALRILVQERGSAAHLVCVGDGPVRQDFENLAREYDLSDRVHCTGAVPQQEVPHWLRGVDVAVAPYPALENFYFSPLKIFEFMALGLPVVAANVGQIPSLVAEGERGLLYSPQQPRELADALSRLLDDRDEARRMGRAGREWVEANATWRDRVATILTSIEALGTPTGP